MKIFLTGGTGFIGSHFINEAHKHGYSIVALRRQGSLPRVPLLKQPIWVNGQLDDDMTTELSGVDTFVHLASHSANMPYDILSKCLYWNVYASLKLAEQAKQCGVSKYLIAGSCFEYGESANEYEEIPVNAPLLPSLPYPVSKAAASLAFSEFATQNMVQLRIVRIFQVYGEGELESRFWPSLKLAAMSGQDFAMTAGEQVRDFIYVGDVAKQIVHALNFKDIPPKIPIINNIGSGNPQTLKQFSEFWWKQWGGIGMLKFGELPYRKNELMRIVPKLDKFLETHPAG